jgi:hypothetical protein
MSEANAPFNRPQPESGDSFSPDLQEPFANPFIDAMKELEQADPWAEPVADPNSVGSVPFPDQIPNQISGQPLDPNPPLSASSESVTLTPGTEAAEPLPESTNLTDLISLIQELNQCNTILLDRVSQLEEALDRSQNALKAEVKRSQDHPTFAEYHTNGQVAVQELSAAQEQIVGLYQQLEFVHQTSQRQQILVETLTEQLEASQERVAHLEREAALVQRRYNEQTQLLTQYENNCRDLQSRLHRQQRYTLQFKAALEKSLEVSSPPFASVADAVAAVSSHENFFLPKVQRIQPWTLPEDYSPNYLPWMKLSSVGRAEESSESTDAEPSLESTPQKSTPQESIPQRSPQVSRWAPTDRRSSTPPRLSVVQLPGFGHPLPRSTTPPHLETAAQTSRLSPQPNSSPTFPAPRLASRDGKAMESVHEAEIPDEKLRQKLDEVVQPLADMLAEVMLAEANQAEANHPDFQPEVVKVEPPKDFLTATPSADEMTGMTEMADATEISYGSDEALLNSVMADAEDALWQDLARLIDVSNEEVVKASLSGDVSAFESIDFQAVQAQATDEQVLSALEEPSPLPGSSNSSEPALEPSPAMTSNTVEPSTSPAPAFGSNPSWPSPVVYPLRPAKKRRSLAAVDLPSFLQQEPGPLPT